MKSLGMSLMLFFVVLVSGNAKAMGTVKVDVIPGEKGKTMVDVLMAPENRFYAEVKDKEGNIVYTDREESFSYNCKKVYDFSSLENGKYTFEIQLGNETEIENLVVNNGKIQMDSQKEQIAPDFTLNGKFLEFSFPNSEQRKARILLYDEGSKRWIFQESIGPEFDVEQALNLSLLKPGKYEAVLISGNESYNYNFYLG